MKAFIVEDELIAQNKLSRMLKEAFDDVEIVGSASSVKDTLEWLRTPDNEADVIFMDVELADGNCFNIFREQEIKANVVMTTAYDSYAIKAFEAGSLDYLLKPIEPEALARAVSRCRNRLNVPRIEDALKAEEQQRRYKDRFLVRIGDQIIPIMTSDIAYIHSESKSNYIFTRDTRSYIIDQSMEAMEEALDPKLFFRCSRGCIIARNAVKSVSKHISGRLRIVSEPEPPFETTVSRARVDDFLEWLK